MKKIDLLLKVTDLREQIDKTVQSLYRLYTVGTSQFEVAPSLDKNTLVVEVRPFVQDKLNDSKFYRCTLDYMAPSALHHYASLKAAVDAWYRGDGDYPDENFFEPKKGVTIKKVAA